MKLLVDFGGNLFKFAREDKKLNRLTHTVDDVVDSGCHDCDDDESVYDRFNALKDDERSTHDKHIDHQHGFSGSEIPVFIDNHDENSWAGTIEERLGEAHRAMAVYIYTIPGVPLMYNGQEAGLNKRLEFFERDPIEWKESDLTPFYTTLNNLKTDNVALYNGTEGGSYQLLQTSGDEDICAYLREKDGNSVIAIINMSAEPATFTLNDTTVTGIYNDCFTDTAVTLSEGITLQLGGWEYLLVNRLPLN